MNPFDALYFLKNNGKKMAIVLMMIALTALLYVGGSYLSNIEVESLAASRQMKNWTFVYSNVDDSDGAQMAEVMKILEQDTKYRLMAVGGNSYCYPTTLGFQNGQDAISFTEEDFRWLNKREHLISDESKIADNTLILSKREAEYLGISDGDLFTENREEALFRYGERPYRVVISDTLDNFFCCLIANDSALNDFYILTFTEEADEEELLSYADKLKREYPGLVVNTDHDREVNLRNAFAINKVIFLSIIAVVTCVFFVTINAVLVGIYEKRRSEFTLYHSIGIPEKKICRKVAKELALITLIGMLLGIALAFLVISILNLTVYRGTGLRLYYNDSWSIVSFLICNACILFPSVLLRIRMVKKIGKEAMDI